MMISYALIQMLKKVADETARPNFISQVKSLDSSAELPGGQAALNRTSGQSLALRHSAGTGPPTGNRWETGAAL